MNQLCCACSEGGDWVDEVLVMCWFLQMSVVCCSCWHVHWTVCSKCWIALMMYMLLAQLVTLWLLNWPHLVGQRQDGRSLLSLSVDCN